MNLYLDANALVRLHLRSEEGEYALAALERRLDAVPIPVTDLLRFEAMNAIERMVFESRRGGRWRVTPEAAAVAQADFAASLEAGVILRRVPLTLQQIETEFSALVARHTAREGFRTYDMLHVASALTLRCTRFLSFDTKANKLAKLVGLETL